MQRGIASWAFFLGVSNKLYPASSFSLLDCIYLQRWFSASKGFGKTVQRFSGLQYSTWVTPICRGDNRCLLFISKNKMEMTTRMQTSCCCCSKSQHLLPSRDSIFKISLVLCFWWGCQTLPGAASGVLTLLSFAFPAPPSSPLSLCSTLKHSYTHYSWNGINNELAKVYLHLMQSQLCSSCPLNYCLQARQSNISHARKQQGEKSSTSIAKHLNYCHFPGEPQWCGMTCDKQGSFQWKLGAGKGR